MVAALSSLQHRNTKCVSPFSMGRVCVLFMFNSCLIFPFGWRRLHWKFFACKCNACKGTNAPGSTCMMHVFCTGKITKCFGPWVYRVLEDIYLKFVIRLHKEAHLLLQDSCSFDNREIVTNIFVVPNDKNINTNLKFLWIQNATYLFPKLLFLFLLWCGDSAWN